MKAQIKETAVNFGSHGIKLSGRLILPSKADSPLPAAILCHGFGASKKAMTPSGRSLAEQGIASLVFDLRGHGDSHGAVDGLPVDDVLDAWEFICCQPEVDTRRIAFVGHSLGAMSAIFAASEVHPRALVLLSCPPETSDEFPADNNSSNYGRWGSDTVLEYPRHGAFPWLSGIAAIACRLWMYLHSYSVRVNWQKFFQALRESKMSPALEKLDDCSKLFVFCLGDKVTPYSKSSLVYQTAPMPKEVLLASGGNHTAPLSSKMLRASWLGWTRQVLNGED
jgi:fermentation-respiration switch protein FrsA (DUF1100 family)